MRSCGFLTLIACLLGQTCIGQARDAERGWDDLLTELRSLKRVTGFAVGGGGVAGKFFKLSKSIIRTGREEDFQMLLTDEQPVARCMGLLALAQTEGKESIPALKAQLADEVKIEYMPGGCVGYPLTVARFARELLHNANVLEHPRTPSIPLMSKRELLGIDLEMLAKAPAIGRFDRSASALTKAMEASKRVPRLRFFERLSPSLEGYEIVKALGRLRYSEPHQGFLIRCLRDAELDAKSRLAAASALTRHANNVSFEALQTHREALNSFGDQLLETLKLRQEYEKNRESLRSRWPWSKEELAKYKAVLASTRYHPLALDDLLSALGPSVVRRSPEVCRTFASSVTEISRNVGDSSQPWNTYSDSATKLALLIERERQGESSRILTDAECAEIERNIKGVIRDR